MAQLDSWRHSQRPPQSSFDSLSQALVSAQMLGAFKLFGAALVVASVVYLFGANWLLLPKIIKLAMAPVLMLLLALISLRTSGLWMSVLHTAAGVMSGLSLAAVGQVYQTGADSFWLFVIWSILLVPWLYRKNLGVYLLLSAVSQTALWLYFDQSHHQTHTLALSSAALFIIQYVLFGRDKASLWVMSIGLVGLSLFAALNFHHQDTWGQQLLWLFIAMVPLGVLVLSKRQVPLMATVLTGVITSLFILVLAYFNVRSFWVYALAAQLWFGLCAWGLYRYFGAHKNKYAMHIPLLAIGGWLSCLFVIFGLITWIDDTYALWGALATIVGLGVLWRGKVAYFRHLGYSSVMIGMGLITLGLSESFELSALGILSLVWLPILGVLYRLRVHWLYLLLHILGWYGVLMGYALYLDTMRSSELYGSWGVWSAMVYGLGLMGCVLLMREGMYWRTVSGFILSIAVGFGVMTTLPIGIPPFWSALGLLAILGALLMRLPPSQSLKLSVLGLLAGIGFAPILAVILVFASALSRQDRLMTILSILVGIGLLWLMYYQLSVPFLVKFIIILSSGLLMTIVATVLDERSQHGELEQAGVKDAKA